MTESDQKKYEAAASDETTTKYHGFGIRHVQMICMSFAMVAMLLARSCMGVAILAMTNTQHQHNPNIEVYEWDKKTQGLILSSFFWGYMCMQIPGGLLAKKFGGKPIILVALVSNVFLTGLFPTFASVGGWWLVCVSRVAMGLSQACLFPASHTLLGQWLPISERTSYTGIVYSASQIGTIIAMPLSGFLAETALGWKMIFYVTSAIMFLTAGLWYWFSASSPAQHSMMTEEERNYIELGLNSDTGAKENRPIPWRAILTTPPFWAILSSHIGAYFTFTLFFVDLPTYLEKGMHISLRSSASLSALPFVGMWVGNFGSAMVGQKLINSGLLSLTACRKIFNSLALFGAALGIIALAFLGADHKNIAITILVSVFFLFGFTGVGFMVNHLDLSPQFAGVMLSLTNFAGSLGSITTPVVTSIILRNDPSDMSRWRIVFFLVAAIGVTTNLIYVIFGSSERQPWDSADYNDRKRADPEEMKPLGKSKEKEMEANSQ
ncbi:putative inorganic phosphate cotransporter [Trichoplusia ni]|uniref:Inorganic phosphate cotransporter n=1 Tax=Trichoplusia ni TaxID=7111 RepID=A0A7E5W4P1_TRINI|nr:putative inorganic phosphate cotransporter [Trichoplusia ni]XP_026735217.1 putative inorganic phosphate cotransporter [Trichoplusia ni]